MQELVDEILTQIEVWSFVNVGLLMLIAWLLIKILDVLEKKL